eukprot:TRINITY_DN14224_c0_g1_i1.p1 TRINITY_DN14224_c0_g1~~TRINITY_DN14224_c0_g1_i1.p1  ORF type:complete len:171 (-),score=24.78 TRINITY_DN14224_c0_g1_i1:19-531(-)
MCIRDRYGGGTRRTPMFLSRLIKNIQTLPRSTLLTFQTKIPKTHISTKYPNLKKFTSKNKETVFRQKVLLNPVPEETQNFQQYLLQLSKIKTYKTQGYQEKAESLKEEIITRNLAKDVNVCNWVLYSLERGGDIHKLKSLVKTMKANGLKPNKRSYLILINCVKRLLGRD